MSDKSSTLTAVESTVWRELSKRRWFGKHVEEEEMDALESDLHAAINEALTGPQPPYYEQALINEMNLSAQGRVEIANAAQRLADRAETTGKDHHA